MRRARRSTPGILRAGGHASSHAGVIAGGRPEKRHKACDGGQIARVAARHVLEQSKRRDIHVAETPPDTPVT
jgi:hypothetical protein